MKILIGYFKTYGNNLLVPESAINEAKDCIGNNNIIKDFMEAKHEETGDDKDSILRHDIGAGCKGNRVYFDQLPLRQ